MAGEAQTTEFLLSTATLMVGPSAKVFELDPTTYSLGLIKNVQLNVDMTFTELGQGVSNTTVSSVNTGLNAKITAELYEFSAKNLAFGSQLDGTSAGFQPITASYALNSAVTGPSPTVVLTAGSGTNFAANDFVILQDTVNVDRLHVGKVASVATDTLTLAAGYTVPTGQTFAVATTKVYKVRSIDVGPVPAAPTWGAKLVGIMPEGGAPITLIFPKIRITKGISMAFQQDQFSNMPFEFTPYQLTPTDSYYSDFGTKMFKVLKNK